MPFQPGSANYTQAFGTNPENVEVPHLDVRAPATTDILYPVGKVWVDTVGNASYTLTSFSSSANVTTATWVTTGGGSGQVSTLTGDSGTATPSGGNIKIAGTANQIVTSASGSTVTLALTGPYTPATYTAHGVLVGEGTSSIAATAAGTTGQVLIGSTGADPAFGALGVNSGLTAHGVLLGEGNSAIVATAVGATNSVLQGSTGADPSFTTTPTVATLTTTGLLTGGTGVTATTGALTASNGNLVLGTAGNKIISTSVGSGTSAGANSFGTVTLTTGTATVSTTAVTASSIIMLTRQSPGATGANPLGMLSVGTIVAGTSFVINALTTANSTTNVSTDVSVIGWMIIN